MGPDTPTSVSSDASSNDPDAVVRAAQAGQAWALRAVYDELSPRVFGYLRSRGADEPEDLTSEVFLAVFSRLASVTGGAAGLRSLVFSIAHARLVDSLRARARRPAAAPYEPKRDLRVAPSAEHEAELLQAQSEALALLAQLPDSQREVLTLRLVADLSLEQSAEILGTSVGAVKQLQRRGLLRLKTLLSTACVTP